MVIVYLMEHEVGPAFLINLLPCELPCLSTLPLFAGLQDIIRPTNIEGWHYEMWLLRDDDMSMGSSNPPITSLVYYGERWKRIAVMLLFVNSWQVGGGTTSLYCASSAEASWRGTCIDVSIRRAFCEIKDTVYFEGEILLDIYRVCGCSGIMIADWISWMKISTVSEQPHLCDDVSLVRRHVGVVWVWLIRSNYAGRDCWRIEVMVMCRP